MELIPINESKLKIMLDESDMKEYNIGDEADCASSETRLAIRHILDRAKSQIGFDTEGSEIFVQLYTSKRGGCELFITKGSLSSNTEPQRQAERKNKKSRREECQALTVRGEAQMNSGKNDFGRMVFSFETLHDLCTVCRILSGLPIVLKSHAFIDDCDDFYLVLENTNVSAYTRLDRLTFIIEYGTRERADHTSTYLFEHAKPICRDNAVATLALF